MLHRSSCLLTAMALGAVGCGPGKVTLKGSVSYDGHAVDRGSIAFLPEDGTGRKAAAAITDGKYEVDPARAPRPGKFSIEVRWAKKTGRTIPSADGGILVDETKEGIPAKYNSATTLTRDITGGDNILDFHLPP